MSIDSRQQYLDAVKKDFQGLKVLYPFASLIIPPTSTISEVSVKVIAANKNLIEDLAADPDDFTGEFSRELIIRIPFDYRKVGCEVYGGAWIDISRVPKADRHFYDSEEMRKFCVGVPDSFSKLSNVLLENVRTAEYMLIAYEQLQKGHTEKLNLNAYSHGKVGISEYRKDRKRYRA